MKRWLDSEVPDDLRRVLQSAGQDAHPAAVARVEQALGRTLGAGAVAAIAARAQAASSSGATASAGGAAAGGALGSKLVLMLAAAGAVGALALRSHTASSRPSADRAPHASAFTKTAVPAAPPVAQAAPVQLATVVPGAPDSTGDEAVAVATAPARVERDDATPALRGGARTPRAGSQLSSEVRQLDAIRRNLRSDTARALAAADAHERRFPNGALAEERELLRIEALFRAARRDEALRRADRLVASPSGNAYRRQVQRLIARYAHVENP